VFCALLDTSVLWPSLQRDFLLSLAAVGLYRPLWSEQILEELETAELTKLTARGATHEQARARTARLLSQMRQAFTDALVCGHDPLVGTYHLPDPDDEHVVAAAVVGGAGAIVTPNLKHLPTSKVPSRIGVLPPAEFARDIVTIDPSRAFTALTRSPTDTSTRPLPSMTSSPS
jgi:hypothetical protein